MKDIVIATENEGKLKEIEQVLSSTLKKYDIEILSLKDFPHISLPEETGTTFEANAIIKAMHVYRETGLWALADDSGLEVASLKNRPGVFSKRFAGLDATDDDNNKKLLDELREFNNGGRSAAFRCALCFIYDNEDLSNPIIFEELFTGSVEGVILTEPIGSRGFGYDPLFLPDGYFETMAQISPSVKNSISHRGRALARFSKFFETLIDKESKI